MIRACINTCGKKQHTQDQLHGQGNRVFNEKVTKDGQLVLKCTVCGDTVTTSAPSKEKK